MIKRFKITKVQPTKPKAKQVEIDGILTIIYACYSCPNNHPYYNCCLITDSETWHNMNVINEDCPLEDAEDLQK